MVIYVADCEHCGWHFETSKLGDFNWETASSTAHCRRVPKLTQRDESEPLTLW